MRVSLSEPESSTTILSVIKSRLKKHRRPHECVSSESDDSDKCVVYRESDDST
jgi:hypothetical protein